MTRLKAFFEDEPEMALLIVALVVVSLVVFGLSYVDPLPHYIVRSVLQ